MGDECAIKNKIAMKYSYLILSVCFFISCTSNRKAVSTIVPPEPSPIVLDHIYFMVPDHGKEAIRLLTDEGFVVNPRIFQIPGEGLASKLVLLDNISLEILWVDDSSIVYYGICHMDFSDHLQYNMAKVFSLWSF